MMCLRNDIDRESMESLECRDCCDSERREIGELCLYRSGTTSGVVQDDGIGKTARSPLTIAYAHVSRQGTRRRHELRAALCRHVRPLVIPAAAVLDLLLDRLS